MTPETFVAKHGPKWKEFESSQIGHDFLLVVSENSPARSIPQGNDMSNLRLAGAPVLLNEIAGYELLAKIIRSLGREPKPPLPPEEDTFTETEI